MGAPPIRVLLADDHVIVLEGLKAVLEAQPDIAVVGATTQGAEVMPLVEVQMPDVLVLDLELGGVNGAEILAALKARAPLPRVLILTAYTDGESIRSVLDAGADGLALKTELPQHTVSAIRQVHAGQLVFPQAARRWLAERTERGAPGGDLTPRERDVWALLADGLSNPVIARRLGVSDHTVKFHVQHLLTKLQVKNRTEAALRFARQQKPRPG
jgi:DNA-binding NarL/FixJ family response regulator